MATIYISARGPIGAGKSAILGEIEIALLAIGVPVEWQDTNAAESEKRMTHADWESELERTRPNVVLIELHGTT